MRDDLQRFLRGIGLGMLLAAALLVFLLAGVSGAQAASWQDDPHYGKPGHLTFHDAVTGRRITEVRVGQAFVIKGIELPTDRVDYVMTAAPFGRFPDGQTTIKRAFRPLPGECPVAGDWGNFNLLAMVPAGDADAGVLVRDAGTVVTFQLWAAKVTCCDPTEGKVLAQASIIVKPAPPAGSWP